MTIVCLIMRFAESLRTACFRAWCHGTHSTSLRSKRRQDHSTGMRCGVEAFVCWVGLRGSVSTFCALHPKPDFFYFSSRVALLDSCEQVAHPLDFSTIKKRQKRGNYAKQGFSKLWEDISTVYRNAQLFNQVGCCCLAVLAVLDVPVTHRTTTRLDWTVLGRTNQPTKSVEQLDPQGFFGSLRTIDWLTRLLL